MRRRFPFMLLALILLLGVMPLGKIVVPVIAEEIIFDHFIHFPLMLRPLPAADLAPAVTSAPQPYVAGAGITYVVTVFNAGPAAVTAITLTRTLPAALLNPTFLPGAGAFNPATGVWQGIALTAGSRVTLTIAASVAANYTGLLRATVAVEPIGAYDPNHTNDQAQNVNPTFDPITDALLNPGFEGITESGGITHDTFNGEWYDNIMTPEGWVTWWEEGAGSPLGRPEVMPIPFEGYFIVPVPRVRSGHWALKFFTFWRPHRGGVYQTVANLPAGSHATLSAFAHAWSCNEDDTDALSCGEDPYQFGFKVGIDPTGGSNPWSSNIVWSDMAYIYDVYGLVGPVEATVGQEGRITVFLLSEAKWGNKHEDAYWDDVSLVITP